MDELSSKTGVKLDNTKILQAVPEEQRSEVETKLIQSTKSGIINLYVKGLEDRIKKAIDAGVPKNHPWVLDHQSAINKIKSL
jgi:hypothetical protein